MKQPDKDIQDVLEQLSVLDPTPADVPQPAPQALAALKQQIEPVQSESWIMSIRRWFAMSNRKTAAVLATLVLFIAVAFSFPTVRAAASDFLGLFRVQKFAAVSISPEQIAVLEQLAEEGVMPGEFVINEEPGALAPVDSLAEATAVTGLSSVRSPADLGEPQEIYVADGGNGYMRIDVAGTRAILAATGVDPALVPDSVDGKRVNVVLFAGVEQHWSDGTLLEQTESPLVEYPEELDPTILGTALLQVLGMEEAEAQRLAQSIDWTSTLLLPIPEGFATFSEVQVDGVSGMALNSMEGNGAALLWQKDNMVYLLLNENATTADLVAIANSMQ